MGVFDAIFLREIVGALDENKSFSEIFVFIAVMLEATKDKP